MELGREEEGGGREDKLEEGVEDSDDYYFLAVDKGDKRGERGSQRGQRYLVQGFRERKKEDGGGSMVLVTHNGEG